VGGVAALDDTVVETPQIADITLIDELLRAVPWAAAHVLWPVSFDEGGIVRSYSAFTTAKTRVAAWSLVVKLRLHAFDITMQRAFHLSFAAYEVVRFAVPSCARAIIKVALECLIGFRTEATNLALPHVLHTGYCQ